MFSVKPGKTLSFPNETEMYFTFVTEYIDSSSYKLFSYNEWPFFIKNGHQKLGHIGFFGRVDLLCVDVHSWMDFEIMT